MIEKMKIIILLALISISVTLRVHKSTDDNNNPDLAILPPDTSAANSQNQIKPKNSDGNNNPNLAILPPDTSAANSQNQIKPKNSDDNSKKESPKTNNEEENIDLYDTDYFPVCTSDPRLYGESMRDYYYYPFSPTFTYNPKKLFYNYRKSGMKTSQSLEASRTGDKKNPAGKEIKKQEKIQVNVKELEANLKKLKKELWGDENKSTAELRLTRKAYDPAWLTYQLNIATVLQIEDLLKENKSNSVKSVTKL
jgi:hypothetical protein